MKRYEVCARGYAWLAERESADGLWVKYDEAAAECDELRQQLTKANTMLLFTRAERDSLQHQLAAAQERNTAEKKRREYYQHIVYSVCNMLDQIDGRHHCIVCGTAEDPCNNVEAKIQQLTTELDSLRQQLAAAQERNVALQSEHLNHVNALHEQLTAMTAERDSESRWAKHYSDKVTELEQQLAAMQRIIDSYRRII